MTDQSNAPTCANCRYAREATALQGRAIVGQRMLVCRRFPPQPMVAGRAGVMDVTPLPTPVPSDHWCGEHTPSLAS